jgi:hypothetical protein
MDADLEDRRASAPAAWAGRGESIGDRLRSKYDLAVEAATRGVNRRVSRRSDRSKLVEHVVEHRLRVPEPSEKTALRQIARDTGSSYSRVRQCEQQLHTGIRRALAGDIEFRRLLELSRKGENGTNEMIDPAADKELRRLGAEVFWRKFGAMSKTAQAAAWARLLQQAGDSFGPAVKRWFAELPREKADKLVALVTDAK